MSASFAATAAWGLIVLGAFIGWGGAIGAWFFPRQKTDLGLRAAWGMALAILFGGVFCLFNLASKPALFAFVALGFGLAAVRSFSNREEVRASVAAATARFKEYPGSTLLLILCAAAALLQYLGSICNLRFNPNDDFVAYFPFAEQILQQGTIFDPFSTRRVMSLGGQSFLHALILAGSPGFRLHMLDQGICLLISALLVIGDRRGRAGSLPSLLALLLLLTLPDIRANTYPQLSGVVAFYGLYRTLVWLDDQTVETTRTLANAVIVALLASAACTLRSNYIAVAVPMVTLSYAHSRRLREAVYAAALSAGFLAPWMAMSYLSSGTPLFPILKGHFNDAFPMLQHPANLRQQLSDLVDTVTKNRVLRTFPLLFLAGFLVPDRGLRRPLHALLIASLVGWVLLVHMLASDAPSFERYVYAFLVAGALAVTSRVAIDGDELRGARRFALQAGQVITILAVLGQGILVGETAFFHHQWLLRDLEVMSRLPIRAPQFAPAAQRYQKLQASIPPGEPLLVMVDFPFLFDFSRNKIYNMDTAAAVSPPPGMPYFRGPEAAAHYLRGQSIRYLAFVAPNRALSLFRRDVWERQQIGPHPLWRAQAPVYLDIFDNFASLAASRKNVFNDGTLVLLDLSERNAAATSASAPRPQE